MSVASWSTSNLGEERLFAGVVYAVNTSAGVPVTVYTDITGATPASSNYFTVPDNGEITLYAAAGQYNLVPQVVIETGLRPKPYIIPASFS